MNQQFDPSDQWPVSAAAPTEDRSFWGIGLVIGVVGVCLLAGCLAAGYYFIWPNLQPEEPVAAPAIPTLPGTELSSEPEPESEPNEEATAALPTSGPTVTTLPTSRRVVAVSVADAPTIDGTLSEWRDAPPVASAFRVYNVDTWDGTSDLTALWQLAWDPQNLYVGVEVGDDIHVQTQSGQRIYQGDSLEIQIDTNPNASASRVNPNTYQIILSPGNFDSLAASVARFQGTEGGQLELAADASIRLQARPSDSGYTLEAAIPWQALGVAPQEGMELGVALSANDNDSPGTAAQEVMMSHVSTRTLTNPRSWGTLVLD